MKYRQAVQTKRNPTNKKNHDNKLAVANRIKNKKKYLLWQALEKSKRLRYNI